MYFTFAPINLCPLAGRSLLDVRTRMQHNVKTQRLISREAEDVQLDMMKQDMVNKGMVGVASI